MKITTFVRKYHGKVIADWGAYQSDEFKQFARNMKATIKDICKENNAELEEFSVGHYYVSGFAVKNGKHIYFSFHIPRHFPLDLGASDCSNGILIRTAEHTRDFRGGHNNFCNISGFAEMMNKLTR